LEFLEEFLESVSAKQKMPAKAKLTPGSAWKMLGYASLTQPTNPDMFRHLRTGSALKKNGEADKKLASER
jgi:hypothetical protein